MLEKLNWFYREVPGTCIYALELTCQFFKVKYRILFSVQLHVVHGISNFYPLDIIHGV